MKPVSLAVAKRCAALLAVAFPLTLTVQAAGPKVERIGPVAAAAVSAQVAQAVEEKGYRVTLDDGWAAEFWFARQLSTATKDAAGALYPELASSEFVGVVTYPKGASDFRGQAIAPGTYTLRFQLIPQDANHMGVSPNPDFLLAIPAASDPDPAQGYVLKKLVSLSAKATGTSHPAVIALETAGEPGSAVKDGQGMTVFTVAIPSTGATQLEKLGIVLKGQATQ